MKISEYCENCREETEHEVELNVPETGNGVFSKEPLRITECVICGHVEETKVSRE